MKMNALLIIFAKGPGLCHNNMITIDKHPTFNVFLHERTVNDRAINLKLYHCQNALLTPVIGYCPKLLCLESLPRCFFHLKKLYFPLIYITNCLYDI